MKSSPNDNSANLLQSVIATPELYHRTPREVSLHEESRSFQQLAETIAAEPERCLDKLVEIAVQLCGADTVGISVEETDVNGEQIFRWVAMAGKLKQLVGGTTPRNFSPCGVCVDTNQPLLMNDIDRAYPYLKDAPLPFVEALLLPWGSDSGPRGTIWIVSHSHQRKFDLQDVRIMSCLAAFAHGALRLKQQVQHNERAATAQEMTESISHHINNPLQAAYLATCLLAQSELSPAARKLITILDEELQRIASVSATVLNRSNVRIPAANAERTDSGEGNGTR